MMRLRYLVLPIAAALALPLAARSDEPAKQLPGAKAAAPAVVAPAGVPVHGGGDCAGGDCGGGRRGLFGKKKGCNGGGGHGLFGGGGIANSAPAYPQRNGLGFHQPPFQANPWYLYWPYDAHFQLPAPIHAPYIAPHMNTPWNPYYPGQQYQLPGHAGVAPGLPPGAIPR